MDDLTAVRAPVRVEEVVPLYVGFDDHARVVALDVVDATPYRRGQVVWYSVRPTCGVGRRATGYWRVVREVDVTHGRLTLAKPGVAMRLRWWLAKKGRGAVSVLWSVLTWPMRYQQRRTARQRVQAQWIRMEMEHLKKKSVREEVAAAMRQASHAQRSP